MESNGTRQVPLNSVSQEIKQFLEDLLPSYRTALKAEGVGAQRFEHLWCLQSHGSEEESLLNTVNQDFKQLLADILAALEAALKCEGAGFQSFEQFWCLQKHGTEEESREDLCIVLKAAV